MHDLAESRFTSSRFSALASEQCDMRKPLRPEPKPLFGRLARFATPRSFKVAGQEADDQIALTKWPGLQYKGFAHASGHNAQIAEAAVPGTSRLSAIWAGGEAVVSHQLPVVALRVRSFKFGSFVDFLRASAVFRPAMHFVVGNKERISVGFVRKSACGRLLPLPETGWREAVAADLWWRAKSLLAAEASVFSREAHMSIWILMHG